MFPIFVLYSPILHSGNQRKYLVLKGWMQTIVISAARSSRVHCPNGHGVFCGTILRHSATTGASCWSQELKFPAVPGNPRASGHSSYFKCVLTGSSHAPLLCCWWRVCAWMDQGQLHLIPRGRPGTAKALVAPALLGARDKDISGSCVGLCLGMLSCMSCLENRPHSVPSCCHCHEGGHGSHRGACWDFPKQFGEGLSPRCAAELWSAVVPPSLLCFHVGGMPPGDLSSCDDRTSQVFPLQDMAVGGGDSESAFVAVHRSCSSVRLLLQDTHWALRAQGVKLLPNRPLHANKVPWSWSSRQTPGYYPSI